MGSVLRHICPVLVIAAVAGAMDIASAQPIGSAPPDIRTGVYRGHVVTYEVIDGLAVWDGDITLGTPEELEPSGAFAVPGKALDSRTKALVAVRSKGKTLARRGHPLRHRSRTHQPAYSQRDPALGEKHRHPSGGKNGSAELGSLRAERRMQG